MNNESDRQEERDYNRKPRFDGTVTLGNVISIIAMLGTMLALWRNMETRVALIEERQRVQTVTVDKLVSTVEGVVLLQARQISTPHIP